MTPGTVWNGNKMLVQASEMMTLSTEDDRLYEWSTGLFIRDEWIGCMQQAARKAEGWVVIAKVEMVLLTALISPMWVILAVSAAKAALFYASYKRACDVAMTNAWPLYKLFVKWKTKYPTLWKKIRSKAVRGWWDEVKHENVNLVTAEDGANFVAGLLKGLSGAPELGLAIVLRIIGWKGFVGGMTVLGKGLGRAAPSAVTRPVHEGAEQLRQYLTSIGYQVSADEARQILQEFAQDREATQDLRRLEVYLRAVLPSLQTLYRAYQKGI
jgi:hypothetical protein